MKKSSLGSDPWKIIFRGFDPEGETLREALCATGNGRFVIRGASCLVDKAQGHYPGTYIAGVYNKTPTTLAGRTLFNEDLVNVPNCLPILCKTADREKIDFSHSRVLSHEQELHLQTGLLVQRTRLKHRCGNVYRFLTERFVHMGHSCLAIIRHRIIPETQGETLQFASLLDGTVENTGVARYRQLNTLHLQPLASGSGHDQEAFLSVRTSHSRIGIHLAARLRVLLNKREIHPLFRVDCSEEKKVIQSFEVTVPCGKELCIEKIVSLTTRSRADSLRIVRERGKTFSTLFRQHARQWKNLWNIGDIRIQGDPFAQHAIRLHIFHLLQTASPRTVGMDVGIPARGLHGEAYRGHIFWDEMFVFPYYHSRLPEVSRSLLLYRYRRLAEARRYAKENGYRGAMFPWQSGQGGGEETQSFHLNPLSGKWGPDHSRIQRHVSFAIAYSTWRYVQTSGDQDFLERYGAELLLAIALFGSSLSRYSAKDRRYHIEGVMGPDEFHEKRPRSSRYGFRDNAYTNLMIAWTLARAGEVLNRISSRTRKRILKKWGLAPQDVSRFDAISRRMCLPMNEHGVLSQFEGFFDLSDIDQGRYKKKYGNIHRMDRILKAEGKTPDDYKILKQADVLMVFYLFEEKEVKELFESLGYPWSPSLLRKNYEYYEPLTTHGSTLSKVVHCYLAGVLGKKKSAWKLFQEVLRSDIEDSQGGTTPEGIHTGVMGGSLDIVLRGFSGVREEGDSLTVYSSLPKHWHKVQFSYLYKGSRFSVCINQRSEKITARRSSAQDLRTVPERFKETGVTIL